MKFNLDAIKKILKHREPFLFIDAIVSMDESSVEASLEIPENNLFLQGHFPGDPVVPGVLLVEAMAQAAGFLMAYNFTPKNEKSFCVENEFFLSKVNSVKFISLIVPPAVLRIKAKIKSLPIENFCEANGEIYVDKVLKVSGSLLLYMGTKQQSGG